jgi:protein-L-isoaspartate(D-aspartate) O-methyltransferase
VGDADGQHMLRFWRMSDTDYQQERYDGFKFVPLIGKEGW